MVECTISKRLADFPRVQAMYAPTPIEPLGNLSRDLGIRLSVKRDDCTSIAFGGNKVRQLEFYLGDAIARNADTLIITGAVQSNFVRTAAAMAAKFGLHCHIQLEKRVDNSNDSYLHSGNVLLNHMLGATVHHFTAGDDENAADAALDEIANKLREKGKNPYVIHLGLDHPPIGALGYVAAALEFSTQLATLESVDEIYIASGSALTHCGLLFGLRVLGIDIPVRGVCVRRDRDTQYKRVVRRFQEVALMFDGAETSPAEISLTDDTLAPGYGVMSDYTLDAIKRTANREGLIVDPTYTGKVMAAIFKQAHRLHGKHVLMWHTGGQAAVFAYQNELMEKGII